MPGPGAAFLATSGPGGAFGFLTEQLHELVVEEAIMYPGASNPVEGHYAVDRATLRRILLAGLDDVVHFGAEFTRFDQAEDGRVVAVFADGRTATGDVLVGADGASSRVRRQYLPQAGHVRPGVGGVAHKVFLTEATRSWIPTPLQAGMNLISHGGVALFTSVFDPPSGAREALERVAGRHPEISFDPYVLCALVTDPAVLPDRIAELDSGTLCQVVDRLLAGWHPDLRRLLAGADPISRAGIEFTASLPTPPWPTSMVTVLGDAIHSMPATGGLGGNTALRDARLLTRMLHGAAQGRTPLLDAIGTYEQHMRAHGYAAVESTLATKDQMLMSGTWNVLAARTWFRLCRAVPAIRRRTFRSWDDGSRPQAWEHLDAAA